MDSMNIGSITGEIDTEEKLRLLPFDQMCFMLKLKEANGQSEIIQVFKKDHSITKIGSKTLFDKEFSNTHKIENVVVCNTNGEVEHFESDTRVFYDKKSADIGRINKRIWLYKNVINRHQRQIDNTNDRINKLTDELHKNY